MQTYSTRIFVLLGCLALFTYCSDEEPEPGRTLDGGPSGAVINSAVTDFTEEVLNLTLGIYVVDGQGNFAGGLSARNFRIESIRLSSRDSISFRNTRINGAQTNPKGAYSATLLLDQSGSISSTDPDDLRIEAAKIFGGALGERDYALLSSFTTYYSDSDVLLHTEFTQDTTELNAGVEELRGSEGGGTPLYKAAHAMVDYTADNGPSENQAIILFTDGENTEYGVSLSQLTEHASDRNVQIYTVGLSQNVELGVLAEIAGETGGAFMWAEDARQLITMFGTLGDLLSGNAQYYQTAWQVARSSGSWRSGQSFLSELNIVLPGGEEFTVPFEVTIPD